MAIVFGKDGTIQCNTVRYNWKQTRNLIADGCFANISNAFTLSNVDIATSIGYKTYRSFHFSTNTTAMITQDMPTPIAGHKYYGACWWRTSGSTFSADDNRFEWYLSDSANSLMVFARKDVATNGDWICLSSIQSLSTVNSGSWKLRNFLVNSSTDSWCTRMMIVDLTDAFGSGNEPTKEWCDENIREHQTFVNSGSMLTQVSTSNFSDTYDTSHDASQGSISFQNYLYWNEVYRPREYTVVFTGDPNYSEGFLGKKTAVTTAIDTTETYYASMETCYSGTEPSKYQCYWPILEPSMGTVPCVEEKFFNGGGGMKGWKRVSFFSKRDSFEENKYPLRWDFDNEKRASTVVSTGHQLCKVSSNVTQYNKYNGTDITIDDVNKAWCDRWIDNRGFSYVHIKDPHNTEIKITPDFDIVCNDIEIRPEYDSIVFKPDGTIICKKLIKAQEY